MTMFRGRPDRSRHKMCQTVVLVLVLAPSPMRGIMAVPLASGPPSAGLSATGDASQTVVHPNYSTIGETAQQRVSWVYDLAEDGARGDAASDTAALIRAISYAKLHPGTVIHVPAGTWALTSAGYDNFILPSDTMLEGECPTCTTLTWNDDQTGGNTGNSLNLFGGDGGTAGVAGVPRGGQSNVTFRNFTVRGKEDVVASTGSGPIGEASSGGYPFLISGVTNLVFDHVNVSHSRIMSIAARYCTGVTVDNSTVTYSSRDAISIGASTAVAIRNNVVAHAGDDSIAVHSYVGDPWGVRRDLIISGNLIYDANGIRVLGARNAVITDNMLDMVRKSGVYLGTESPGSNEAVTNIWNVLVTHNIITNLMDLSAIDSRLGGQDYFVVDGESARKGSYTGVPGFAGSDGVVHPPYNELLANSSSGTTPTPGAMGIVIADNVAGRMVPPTDGTDGRFKTWTDLQSGPLWVSNKENVSPSLPLGSLTGTGVHIYGGASGGNTNNVTVLNNQFSGMFHCFYFDGMTDFGLDAFRGNSCSDMASDGVFVNTAARGTVLLDDNTFDLDPYLTSPHRGANGAWADAGGPPMFYVYKNTSLAFIARRNVLRNASAVGFNTAAPSTLYTLQDNIVQADPSIVGSFSNVNRGVGTLYPTGGFHLLQTDSNPTSPTYGQVLTNGAADEWAGMPVAGKWMQGQALWNSSAGPDNPYAAFLRATTGTANTLNADWFAVPLLVNNQFVVPDKGGVQFHDPVTGKTTIVSLDTSGYMHLFPTGGDGLGSMALDNIQLNQKLFLDANRTMWVQEVSGRVTIGTGNTSLFSIDASGNVSARGSITSNTSP